MGKGSHSFYYLYVEVKPRVQTKNALPSHRSLSIPFVCFFLQLSSLHKFETRSKCLCEKYCHFQFRSGKNDALESSCKAEQWRWGDDDDDDDECGGCEWSSSLCAVIWCLGYFPHFQIATITRNAYAFRDCRECKELWHKYYLLRNDR